MPVGAFGGKRNHAAHCAAWNVYQSGPYGNPIATIAGFTMPDGAKE
jgi:glutamate-1-semialdehyde aminotransferase